MTAPNGYDPVQFPHMAAAEDHHFGPQARFAVASMVLDRYAPKSERLTILDAACGTGGWIRAWGDRGGFLIGVDGHLEALSQCRQRSSISLVQSDVMHLPFRPVFDAVLLLDVLEHLDDDHQALMSVKRALHRDGILIITVPALRGLWNEMDRVARHRRRYSKADLRERLATAGFACLYCTYYHFLTLPFYAFRVCLERLRPRPTTPPSLDRILSLPSALNAAFSSLCTLERRMLRRLPLPIGSSLVAVAKSRDHV